MRNRFQLLTYCVLASSVFLGACATKPTPIYHWGDYQKVVYSGFSDANASMSAAGIQKLEADLEKAKSANKPVAPGFYAHLALLHAHAGKPDIAIKYALSEKVVFPESAVFMDRFIAQLKK